MYIILYVALLLLRIVEIIIIIRCVLSFIPGLRNNKIATFIYWLTDPVLTPARMLIGKFKSSDASFIDFSPIVTYLAIIILRAVLQSIM